MEYENDLELFEKYTDENGDPTREHSALHLSVGKAFIDPRRQLVASYVPEDMSVLVVGLVPVPRRAYERRDEFRPLVLALVREFLRMNAYYLGLHLHDFQMSVELCPENEEDPREGGSPERGLR